MLVKNFDEIKSLEKSTKAILCEFERRSGHMLWRFVGSTAVGSMQQVCYHSRGAFCDVHPQVLRDAIRNYNGVLGVPAE